MCPLTFYPEKDHTITMSTPGVVLSTLVFWLTVYLAVHFYNSTHEEISKMGRPERFAMELLSSSAAAIATMFVLGCIDMVFKSWM
jgi:hypothetical protein